MAGRLGAAPSGLSFGDSAAQAGARPTEKWCGCRESHPDGGRPQGPPWRGGILAVKSQPRKLKGPGARRFVAVRKDLPAHAISTKNKHLLAIYSIPARGFTAAVSVFRGTPPLKPLKCKNVSNHLGARLRSRWADPTGEEFVLLSAIFSFATADIIETSLGYRSQTVHLSLPSFTISSRETKNPAYTR